MKRTYAKPSMTVERFLANVAVAACPTTTTYEPVNVPCIITQWHYIFYDNCSEVAEGANYSDCAVVTYNGVQYLVWSTSSSIVITPGEYDAGTGNNLNGQQLINKLVEATGRSSDDIGASCHAGKITPDITSVVNSST